MTVVGQRPVATKVGRGAIRDGDAEVARTRYRMVITQDLIYVGPGETAPGLKNVTGTLWDVEPSTPPLQREGLVLVLDEGGEMVLLLARTGTGTYTFTPGSGDPTGIPELDHDE